MKTPKFFYDLLTRTGGWYIIITFAIAQLLVIPGAGFGLISIQINADLTTEQLRQIITLITWLFFSAYLILLIVIWLMSSVARKRLDVWKQGIPLSRGTGEEFRVWKQITGITWRYGFIAIFVTIIFDVVIGIVYSFSLGIISYDQAISSLIGGTAAVITTNMFSILFIDWVLTPAWLILAPQDYESKLEGRSGTRLVNKFLILISTLIVIGILMIGLIGHNKIVTVLSNEFGSAEALSEFQFQSIAASLVTLALGGGLAFLVSRSILDPIRDLIEIIKKVGEGDLSQRAKILATDETAEVAIYFNHMIARLEEFHRDLEKQVIERTAQLQAVNEVSRIASISLNPDNLVKETINIIAKEFSFHSTSLYLTNPSGTWLDLKETIDLNNSEVQKKKKLLQIDRKSMVGRSVLDKKAQFSGAFDETDLIEIAVPVMDGNKVLGALSILTNREMAINQQNIETLQNIASQLAIGLENARLFQDTSRNLQELQAIQNNFVQKAWMKTKIGIQDFQYAVGDLSDGNTLEVLNVPLTLRDQEIGKITLESQDVWEPEDKALVEAIAVQAALALENARLLEEGQSKALRERLTTEISGRIWRSTTLDGAMQTALQELGSLLDASEATIELEVD